MQIQYAGVAEYAAVTKYAGVAELADALASGASGSNAVWVRVPFPA